MSDEEKMAQIGEAAVTLERQKHELAHLTAKIEKVRLAYRTFASDRPRWRVDAAGDGGKVFLAHPAPEERELAAYLLDQSELAALIVEHRTAEDVRGQTKAKLASFGITSV